MRCFGCTVGIEERGEIVRIGDVYSLTNIPNVYCLCTDSVSNENGQELSFQWGITERIKGNVRDTSSKAFTCTYYIPRNEEIIVCKISMYPTVNKTLINC